MDHYAGIDVSLECSSVCVVDATGRIVREDKVASEPEALVAWFGSLGFELIRIGLEAGPLSQWLYAGMKQAGLAVELLETPGLSPCEIRGCRSRISLALNAGYKRSPDGDPTLIPATPAVIPDAVQASAIWGVAKW
jgi:hypothetical protein